MNQIRRCLALIGFTLAVAGWSTASAAWHKGAYHQGPEPWEGQSGYGSGQKVKIRFTAIAPAVTEFSTKITENYCCRVQAGFWQSTSGDYPRALFVLVEMVSKNHYFSRRVSLDSSLRKLFNGKEITVYERVKTNAPNIEYGRFRLSDAECIGVVKYFGEQFFGGGDRPAPGNRYYQGYYCSREKHAIEPILNAISVSD